MKDLTVIIPVHKYDDSVKPLLTKAVESFYEADKNSEAILMFVGPKGILDAVKKDLKLKKSVILLENDETEFASQINLAVDNCTTKYFSILEYDDTFTPIWFDNVQKQIDMNQGISIFLPLTELIDASVKVEEGEEQEPVGYVNESVWASSFSDEIGYLDLESLKVYMEYNTTGGVFNKDDFVNVGKLKASMKLSFWYEFLLRAVNNGKKVYVIPKVGYRHNIMREDSLSDFYSKNMSTEEADFWVELAKKEYLFKKDRNKKYEEE